MLIKKRGRGIPRIYPFDKGVTFTVVYSGERAERVSLLTSLHNCARHWRKVSGESWQVKADISTELITCTKISNSDSESKFIVSSDANLLTDSQ